MSIFLPIGLRPCLGSFICVISLVSTTILDHIPTSSSSIVSSRFIAVITTVSCITRGYEPKRCLLRFLNRIYSVIQLIVLVINEIPTAIVVEPSFVHCFQVYFKYFVHLRQIVESRVAFKIIAHKQIHLLQKLIHAGTYLLQKLTQRVLIFCKS